MVLLPVSLELARLLAEGPKVQGHPKLHVELILDQTGRHKTLSQKNETTTTKPPTSSLALAY